MCLRESVGGYAMGQFIAIFAALCVGMPSAAHAVPDYVDHQGQFAFAAKVVTSAKSCGHFGYAVDEAAAKRFVDDVLTDAIEDGLSVALANQMGHDALREETERQEFLSDRVKAAHGNTQQEQAALDRFLDYWAKRCRDIAADPRAAAFFKPPAG